MDSYKVIVHKSTVPVETGEKVKKIIKENIKQDINFDVISNPEFLREGTAIKDTMEPDRIVIGINNGKAREIMLSLYKGLERPDKPILFTDVRSAEMIKYGANAFLATKISFINEIAKLCEKQGADVKMVARGIGLDERIGPKFLSAGVGYEFDGKFIALLRRVDDSFSRYQLAVALGKGQYLRGLAFLYSLPGFMYNAEIHTPRPHIGVFFYITFAVGLKVREGKLRFTGAPA